MSTGKKMTDEEIYFGMAEYRRRRRKEMGSVYGIDWYDLLYRKTPDLSDPWAAILEREKTGQTLQ